MKTTEVLNNTFYNKSLEVFNTLDVNKNTRKEYQSRIKLFLDFIENRNIHHNSFLEFKRYLEQRKDFTTSTKNKYLATARIFLKVLNRKGLLPVDITQNIKSFKQSNKHKREGLNQKEINKVIQHLNKLPKNPKTARIKALFCLLAFQGLRQIEIIRMNREDISLINKKAFIQGKGSDDKEYVYLLPETIRALRSHVRVNRVSTGALFKGLGNNKSERITTMTIKREIMKILNELNIEKTVHGFRHYFITTLLKRFDVRDVRKFSRHKSLEMLIVYDDEVDIREKSLVVAECFNGMNVT